MTNYEPKIGDYGIVKTSGTAGKLIRLGTLSHWNHAIIYIGDGFIVEANLPGVMITHADKYDNIVWNRHEEVTDEQRDIIVKHAKEQVDKPYSLKTICIIGFRILGLKALAKLLVTKNLAAKDGYICSELVAESYKTAGIITNDKPEYLITPADLVDRLLFI